MIKYLDGNLLESKCNIICHQVNCKGVMGAGIAKQIKEKWPTVYKDYLNDYSGSANLGTVLFSKIGENQYIANMYSQDNFMPRNLRCTDYYAFKSCLTHIRNFVEKNFDDTKECVIGFPYNIGCGLGGGNWDIIKKLIEEAFCGDEFIVEIWRL